jgi:hypothetical protein
MVHSVSGRPESIHLKCSELRPDLLKSLQPTGSSPRSRGELFLFAGSHRRTAGKPFAGPIPPGGSGNGRGFRLGSPLRQEKYLAFWRETHYNGADTVSTAKNRYRPVQTAAKPLSEPLCRL